MLSVLLAMDNRLLSDLSCFICHSFVSAFLKLGIPSVGAFVRKFVGFTVKFYRFYFQLGNILVETSILLLIFVAFLCHEQKSFIEDANQPPTKFCLLTNDFLNSLFRQNS